MHPSFFLPSILTLTLTFVVAAAPMSSPSFTFTIHSLTAYTTHTTHTNSTNSTNNLYTHDSAAPTTNTTTWSALSFLVRDPTTLALCSTYTPTPIPLWTGNLRIGCRMIHAPQGDEVLFSVGEDLRNITVTRYWNVGGTDMDEMFMSGTATQETKWEGGAGGNMSVGAYGTWYAREEPWEFEITSISG